MFKRLDLKQYTFTPVSDVQHKEYQNVNTRVSEYLRKYGQGKIDSMPADTRAEVSDPRTVDEMLDDPNPEFGLGTDELDVLIEYQQNVEKFKQAVLDIEASEKDKTAFENAVEVLNDVNASYEAKQDAYRILDGLDKKGKLSYS